VAALGISLNYTMFLCIRNNSALTSVMVGHLKTMLQVSFFFRPPFPFFFIPVLTCVMAGHLKTML
jgi:hypothetical protein